MKNIRILHCADIHFDTPFKELGKRLSDNSKEELLEVFKYIIFLVKKEKIDALLISGDLFDNLTVNKTTLYFLINQLNEIPNTYVFISPGNHDPYNEKSFYKIIDWPKNVYIFRGNMEKVEIPELNTVVWGAAFNNKYVKETLINEVVVDESKINIMVMHGETVKGNSQSIYNPIIEQDIARSKMDYIALGHTHEYSEILRVGKTYYAYSGCPQGRGFDEVGDKGVIIGDIYSGHVDLDFIPVCKRKYYYENVDISTADTYDDIRNIIINRYSEECRSRNLYKIILVGNINEHLLINEDLLIRKLANDFYYIKIIDKTEVKINIDEVAKDYSIKGKFVSKVLAMLENAENEEQREMINLALKIGLQCLSDSEVNMDDN